MSHLLHALLHGRQLVYAGAGFWFPRLLECGRMPCQEVLTSYFAACNSAGAAPFLWFGIGYHHEGTIWYHCNPEHSDYRPSGIPVLSSTARKQDMQPRTLGCLLARFGRSGDLSWVMPEEYCGVRWYEMIKRSEAKLSRKNLVYIHGPL